MIFVRRICFVSYLLIGGLLLISGMSCDSNNLPTQLAASLGDDGKEIPEDPGPGNIAGRILGTIHQQPLTDVQVSVGDKSAHTNSDGDFRITGVGMGEIVLVISGAGIYTRTAVIDTDIHGRSVQLDAIEHASNFHLDFYRELVRGNHPSEQNMYPLYRWASSEPPTFYIDTNGQATNSGIITQEMIADTQAIIDQIVPVFSGTVYTAAPVIVRRFSQYSFEAVPDNSIVLSFDDSLYFQGAVGVTFTEPTLTTSASGVLHKAWVFLLSQPELYAAAGISRQEITAHELGHAFGFRHTSLLPSVMVKHGAYGRGLFSEYDALHMAVAYHRPAGNTDIDNDPILSRKRVKQSPEKCIFIDRRIFLPLPIDTVHRLYSLQGLTQRLFEINCMQ